MNIEEIRGYYKDLPDGKLHEIAKNEIQDLSEESRAVVKEKIEKRSLSEKQKTLDCPQCHRNYPNGTLRCDCGYIFDLRNWSSENDINHTKTDIESEKVAPELRAFVIDAFLNGLTKEHIIKILIEKEIITDEHAGRNIIVGATQEIKEFKNKAESFLERCQELMLYGTLWCLGGLLVTGITYAAVKSGGTYIIAFGAVIFGFYDFARGLGYWLQYRKTWKLLKAINTFLSGNSGERPST